MKENHTPSASKSVKQSFYARVAENERNDKKKTVILAALLCVLAIILLVVATMTANSLGKHVYVYGDRQQRIDKAQAMQNGIQFIDMNALAEFAGIEKTTSRNGVTYRVNNTEATFENGKSQATLNKIEISMPSPTVVKNGYCLIPLSVAKDMFCGVEVNANKNNTVITLNGNNIYMIAKNTEIKYEPNISEGLVEYINSTDPYIFKLVNKQNPVDKTFPEDKDSLLEIPAKYRKADTIYLYKTALYPLQAMMDAMFSNDIDDVFVTSAYRRYDKQKQLFDGYVEDFMANGMSYNDAYAEALKDTALPGQSEHQTGLCIDFMTRSMDELDNTFEDTKAFKWLKDNAWKYGFVLRYPEDKVSITGYLYESWHYRFVGLEVASIMYQTGLCYEEYIEYFEKGE